MAGLVLQRTVGGGARVATQTTGTQMARRRAASLGLTGIGTMGRTQEVRPGAGLSFGGILRGAVAGIGGFLTGGPVGAVAGVARTLTGTSSAPPALQCPPGFTLKDGRCQEVGFTGVAHRILPFGDTGLLPQGPASAGTGMAVVGAFGLPALQPSQVGSLTRNDGVTVPLLRCTAGFVLGRDNLCYPRVVLGRRGKFRKHPSMAKAPVTAEDAKCIRRAESAKKRVKNLATAVGFSCAARGARRK